MASQGKGQVAVLTKKGNCVVQGKTWKTDRISLLFGSIKCFPLSFNTFKTLQVAPWWSWYHKLPIKKLKKIVFKGQGAPWEVKGHKGASWW
jgi:hypothetical protein